MGNTSSLLERIVSILTKPRTSEEILNSPTTYVIRETGMIKKRYLLFSIDLVASDSAPDMFGLPRDVFRILTSLLELRDLARAMEVSKEWYRSFGQDFVWMEHLSPSIRRNFPFHGRPAKVEVAYQEMLRRCWLQRAFRGKDLFESGDMNSSFIMGAVVAPNGLWVMTFGRAGKVDLWEGVGTDRLTTQHIGGFPQCNPHQSRCIFEGMVSPDGSSVFTFDDRSRVVRWEGIGSEKVTGEVVEQFEENINDSHEAVFGGRMSQSGTWALVFGFRGRLFLWDKLDTASPVKMALAGKGMDVDPHDSVKIDTCCLSPDETWALTCNWDYLVYWKGFRSGNVTYTPIRGRFDDCCLSPDGSFVLSVGSGVIIQWEDLDSNVPSKNSILDPTFPKPSNIKMSSDGSWVLTVGSELTFWKNLTKVFSYSRDSRKGRIGVTLISPLNEWILLFQDHGVELLRPIVRVETK